MVGSDIESLLGKSGLDLVALTIFGKNPTDPPMSISPAYASNIIVQKKTKSGTCHFPGRLETKSLFQDDLYDFHDVLISVIDDP